MNTVTVHAAQAVVAAKLHEAFAANLYAPDSLELWLAITAEAARHLAAPGEPPQSMPVFLICRKQRTTARYYPATATVQITSGTLTGTVYTDLADAADAVTVVTAGPGTPPMYPLPTWRLDPTDEDAPDADGSAHGTVAAIFGFFPLSGIWKSSGEPELFDDLAEARKWADEQIREFVADFGRDCHMTLVYTESGRTIGRVGWDWSNGTLRWQDADPITGEIAAGGE